MPKNCVQNLLARAVILKTHRGIFISNNLYYLDYDTTTMSINYGIIYKMVNETRLNKKLNTE